MCHGCDVAWTQSGCGIEEYFNLIPNYSFEKTFTVAEVLFQSEELKDWTLALAWLARDEFATHALDAIRLKNAESLPKQVKEVDRLIQSTKQRPWTRILQT